MGFICLSVISLLLSNCQSDDIAKPSSLNNIDGGITSITFNEFKTDAAAYKTLQKYLGEQPGANARAVYNPQYHFTVDTDAIIKVQKGKYSFYTFVVYPDNDEGFTYRLYLHPQANGTYLAYLVEYKLTDQEIANLLKGISVPDLNKKTLYTPLSNFNAGSVSAAGPARLYYCVLML